MQEYVITEGALDYMRDWLEGEGYDSRDWSRRRVLSAVRKLYDGGIDAFMGNLTPA